LAVGCTAHADTDTKGTNMHPSTHQTALGGLFATFWDDAWHTDLGRDQATILPHLPLYASMATISAVITSPLTAPTTARRRRQDACWHNERDRPSPAR